MALNDLTADLLTRIRNAVRNNSKVVAALDNKMNRGVAQVLKDEGYIEGFDTYEAGPKRMLNIKLHYGPRGEKLINSIERVSTPGRRVYRPVGDLPT
ncbi:MAG: 30S ribosomal protein S8 [Candidatus Competibacteraceae bacterium]|nr:30S ribosomal protein S8 [Candidatus Competibacteraceae bacterium]